VAFENRFRRSDDALASRFAKYAADFSKAPAGLPVLDLGCGRGEFLRSLATAGIKGRGVESNASAVAACLLVMSACAEAVSGARRDSAPGPLS